jgi:uncharacterized membrane protein YdbT with pleckstrin-like domain
MDGLRSRLLRLLRVPQRPAPPPGDPRALQTFRAAPGYYTYSVLLWVVKQLSAASGLFISYLFFQSLVRNIPFGYFGLIEQLFIAGFVAQLPFSFLLIRLDYEMRWYMLSDRAMRVRYGIISVHEQTMTFANIQSIATRQNPLQRLFGIATVAVRAAGGGGDGGSGSGKRSSSHEIRFEGVADAAGIRNVIRERLRRYRDAGLGDADEDAALTERSDHGVAGAAPLESSARQLLEEARRLRAVWPAASSRASEAKAEGS